MRKAALPLIAGVGVILVSILSVGGGLGAMGLGRYSGPIGQIAHLFGVGPEATCRSIALGAAIDVLSALLIPAGYGMAKDRRWGYASTVVLSALALPLDLAHLPHGTAKAGLLFNPLFIGYGIIRLARLRAN